MNRLNRLQQVHTLIHELQKEAIAHSIKEESQFVIVPHFHYEAGVRFSMWHKEYVHDAGNSALFLINQVDGLPEIDMSRDTPKELLDAMKEELLLWLNESADAKSIKVGDWVKILPNNAEARFQYYPTMERHIGKYARVRGVDIQNHSVYVELGSIPVRDCFWFEMDTVEKM